MNTLKIYSVEGDKEVLRVEMTDDEPILEQKNGGLTIEKMVEKGMLVPETNKDDNDEE